MCQMKVIADGVWLQICDVFCEWKACFPFTEGNGESAYFCEYPLGSSGNTHTTFIGSCKLWSNT